MLKWVEYLHCSEAKRNKAVKCSGPLGLLKHMITHEKLADVNASAGSLVKTH